MIEIATRGSRRVFFAFNVFSLVQTTIRSASRAIQTVSECGEPSDKSVARCAKLVRSTSSLISVDSAIAIIASSSFLPFHPKSKIVCNTTALPLQKSLATRRLTLEDLMPRMTRIARTKQEISDPCNPRHPRQFLFLKMAAIDLVCIGVSHSSVFGLDTKLDVPQATPQQAADTRAAVMKAIDGHILGKPL